MSSHHLEFRKARVEEIINLRKAVLRKWTPQLSASFDEDDCPQTLHFGAFLEDQAVGCLTMIRSTWENRPAWRLRGMAVDEKHQGEGIGGRLLTFTLQFMKAYPGNDLFWCNARVKAIPFYEKHGWKVVSEEFEIPETGPHKKMVFISEGKPHTK